MTTRPEETDLTFIVLLLWEEAPVTNRPRAGEPEAEATTCSRPALNKAYTAEGLGKPLYRVAIDISKVCIIHR
jgi:hypothetical protein